MTTHTRVPNHHAHHPGFAGPLGLAAALTMVVGRQPDAELAARLVGVEPGDTVVDLGCGPGVAARYASNLGATAIGVDPSAMMLRVARLLTRRSARLRFVDGTAEAIPLEDASASAAWSIATVHHWSDIDAGLHEVRRILKPGGRFVAIERHTTADAKGLASHGWTEEQAAAFATRCDAAGLGALAFNEKVGRRRRVIAVLATLG